MLPWRVVFDPKARVHRHSVGSGAAAALLTALVGNTFETLGIGVTLWDWREWLPIHWEENNITRFEFEHGFGPERAAYNARLFLRAKRDRKTVRGEHAGHSDFFVPVVLDGQFVAVLVAGPFAVARPTQADLLARWRWLTGREGRMTDPEFQFYVRETLSVLVLDKGRAGALRRLLDCYARLMGGVGPAGALANRAYALRAELERARLAERMWSSARNMLDDRAQLSLYDAAHTHSLANLGLSRVADHVVVGLIASRKPEQDSVGDAIRRDAFQRGAVELALTVRDCLAGRIGDHGVFFLCAARGSDQRKRQRALDLVERAAALGRRFGLALHFGVSAAPESSPLGRGYQNALAAAESALTRRAQVVVADEGIARASHALRILREELVRAAEERPELVAVRAERYLETVARTSGQRVEAAQAHLDVGLESLAHALVRSGALDERGARLMQSAVDRASAAAHSMDDLVAAYREAMTDLSRAIDKPAPARQDRSLRAALDHIKEHFGEPLRLARVARIAGFSPNHFSRLFIQRERVPFEKHVARLRLERAKQLLAASDLVVSRVAELSGFRSAQYFCRVFRAATGTTPLEFRRTAPGVGDARVKLQSES